MKVTLFDYGAGNLHSLEKAIALFEGVEVRVETDPRRAIDTDALVLPGVGAFSAAAARLAPGREPMREAILGGLPTLGICLGMQLLFDASDEGAGQGLGVVPGRVTRLRAARVPEIGWNELASEDPLFARAELHVAYYAHSFACRPTDPALVVARSQHEGDTFAAAVRTARTLGVQFHPEKSSKPGSRADPRLAARGVPMIAIPAVDLREGACVQLVGGEYDRERIRLPDPVAVARSWVEKGFSRLHVVDLDAATGRGSNAPVVSRLLASAGVPVQVGGGVRTTERGARAARGRSVAGPSSAPARSRIPRGSPR